MVKVLKSFVLVTFCVTLSVCSPGMHEMLHRTTDDPVVVSPRVESYVESNTIFIGWEIDEGADEYILERAVDHPESLLFIIVYRGKGTAYVDRGLENNLRYIYRLSKTRGSEIFGPSKEALGISSLVIRDLNRNNTMETAQELVSIDHIASLFYHRSYKGLEVLEEDWYYIDIPPLRQAWIMVDDFQASASNVPTFFEYYVYGRESNPVYHKQDFRIVNNALETKRYYFMIYPAKHKFAGIGELPGGGIVHYKICLYRIDPIQIGG